jgi:hypothetical protein
MFSRDIATRFVAGYAPLLWWKFRAPARRKLELADTDENRQLYGDRFIDDFVRDQMERGLSY